MCHAPYATGHWLERFTRDERNDQGEPKLRRRRQRKVFVPCAANRRAAQRSVLQILCRTYGARLHKNRTPRTHILGSIILSHRGQPSGCPSPLDVAATAFLRMIHAMQLPCPPIAFRTYSETIIVGHSLTEFSPFLRPVTGAIIGCVNQMENG